MNAKRFVCVLLLFTAILLGVSMLPAQTAPAVTPAAAVQVNPPGSPLTAQSAWVLTSTGGAQANTLTQPATAGKTNYCTGFEVTGDGATGQSVLTITLASGGTTLANYSYNIVAGATTANPTLQVQFAQPIAGLGPGQTMVLTVPSFGAGNTAASAVMHGFTQ